MPDIEVLEDYSNLGILGDSSEPLLAAALNDIMPGGLAPIRANLNTLVEVSETKANSPIYQIMLAEKH